MGLAGPVQTPDSVQDGIGQVVEQCHPLRQELLLGTRAQSDGIGTDRAYLYPAMGFWVG